MVYGIPALIILSLIIGFIGSSKKCGFWGYFFASLLFTPLGGILLLALSGKKEKNK